MPSAQKDVSIFRFVETQRFVLLVFPRVEEGVEESCANHAGKHVERVVVAYVENVRKNSRVLGKTAQNYFVRRVCLSRASDVMAHFVLSA